MERNDKGGCRVSEWIKVTDELPKDSTKVLCLSVHNLVYATWFMGDNEFFPYAHNVNPVPIGIATHWMPLPDLPK